VLLLLSNPVIVFCARQAIPAATITICCYYNLPFGYSRTIAYFAGNAMLIFKRRFSAEQFIDSFGGGNR
jgi:hypothetical protein